jgi:hypothetical protein
MTIPAFDPATANSGFAFVGGDTGIQTFETGVRRNVRIGHSRNVDTAPKLYWEIITQTGSGGSVDLILGIDTVVPALAAFPDAIGLSLVGTLPGDVLGLGLDFSGSEIITYRNGVVLDTSVLSLSSSGIHYPVFHCLGSVIADMSIASNSQVTACPGDAISLSFLPGGFEPWFNVSSNHVQGTLQSDCLDETQAYKVNVFSEATKASVGSQIIAVGATSYSVDVGTFTGDFVVVAHAVGTVTTGKIATGSGTT